MKATKYPSQKGGTRFELMATIYIYTDLYVHRCAYSLEHPWVELTNKRFYRNRPFCFGVFLCSQIFPNNISAWVLVMQHRLAAHLRQTQPWQHRYKSNSPAFMSCSFGSQGVPTFPMVFHDRVQLLSKWDVLYKAYNATRAKLTGIFDLLNVPTYHHKWSNFKVCKDRRVSKNTSQG